MADPDPDPKSAVHIRLQTQRLCPRCAALDFHTFFTNTPYSPSLDLGPPSSWMSQACDFCAFLARSIGDTLPNGLPAAHAQDKSLSLNRKGFSRFPDGAGVINRVFAPWGNTREDPCCQMWVEQFNIVFAQTPVELVAGTVTPARIDFGIVQGWLEKSAAVAATATEAGGKNDGVADGIAGRGDMELLVIDCETRALRRLPLRAEYLTLSYVWGATARHDVATGSHPGKLEKGMIPWDVPATINDSIVVCRKLGYRYLWVDRYCIPQDDPEERRRQIQRMDVIFQNSTLTIVACAGTDPQYGLPGVSKSREQSPSISLQGAGYLQRTPKIEEIKKSIWAGRGWTYQETILSQMRLYFTDRQLYFESENAVECEWITLAGANTICIPGWEFSKNRQMAKPGYIYFAISEFSERSLSFQSDSLNAMLGIFAAFERKFQLGYLRGMPFLKAPIVEESEHSSPTLQISLFFQTGGNSLRCTEFPSWSWAGWGGIRSWPRDLETHMAPDIDPCVAVELVSGHAISWEDFESDYETLRYHTEPDIYFIHLQAHISPILAVETEPYNGMLICLFSLADGVYLRFDLFQSESAWTTAIDDSYYVLRFEARPDLSGPWHATFPHIVVRNMGTHWERIMLVEGLYENEERKILDRRLCPGSLETVRMG